MVLAAGPIWFNHASESPRSNYLSGRRICLLGPSRIPLMPTFLKGQYPSTRLLDILALKQFIIRPLGSSLLRHRIIRIDHDL